MCINLPVKSKLYQYSILVKNTTNYAKRMNRLSNRIFTEVVRPTDKSSLRVVEKFSINPLDLRKDITDHYPRHIETGLLVEALRQHGLYRCEHTDFEEEMERLRKLRGKGKRVRGVKKSE